MDYEYCFVREPISIETLVAKYFFLHFLIPVCMIIDLRGGNKKQQHINIYLKDKTVCMI